MAVAGMRAAMQIAAAMPPTFKSSKCAEAEPLGRGAAAVHQEDLGYRVPLRGHGPHGHRRHGRRRSDDHAGARDRGAARGRRLCAAGEVTANIHPAVIAVAERAADLIKASR